MKTRAIFSSVSVLVAMLLIALLMTACGGEIDGDSEDSSIGEIASEEVGGGPTAVPLEYALVGARALAITAEQDFTDVFTVELLEGRTGSCFNTHEEGYFEELIALYEDEKFYYYIFNYQGESQEPIAYTLSALRNLNGYTDIGTFSQDFAVCAVGDGYYPMDLTEDWLLFESSCGTGEDDGSGLPVGCEQIRENIEVTLY
jgi:hypothetical protein